MKLRPQVPVHPLRSTQFLGSPWLSLRVGWFRACSLPAVTWDLFQRVPYSITFFFIARPIVPLNAEIFGLSLVLASSSCSGRRGNLSHERGFIQGLGHMISHVFEGME